MEQMTNEHYQQAREKLLTILNGDSKTRFSWNDTTADQILNQTWDNGLPMFGILDPEQELPKMYNATDEPISNFVELAVQNDMQWENWRKVVGK